MAEQLKQILQKNTLHADDNKISKVTKQIIDAINLESQQKAENTGFNAQLIYNSIIYKILSNLDTDSYIYNPNRLDIINNLVGDKLTAKQLIDLKYYELNNDLFYIHETINTRKKQILTEKYSKDLSCFKCKEFKIKVYRNQTRSSDEGYTYRAICAECGSAWNIT